LLPNSMANPKSSFKLKQIGDEYES